jgi:ribosomal subunit interface protein
LPGARRSIQSDAARAYPVPENAGAGVPFARGTGRWTPGRGPSWHKCSAAAGRRFGSSSSTPKRTFRRFAEDREPELEERAQEERAARALASLDDRSVLEIAEIHRALQRMVDGTYRKYLDCGHAIPLARLRALPTATVCVECARQEEVTGPARPATTEPGTPEAAGGSRALPRPRGRGSVAGAREVHSPVLSIQKIARRPSRIWEPMDLPHGKPVGTLVATRTAVDLEIQTQHVAMQPEWRALIEERLLRLAERYPKLVRVHVTLKHGRHHLRGAEEVDIVATYPGATIRAAKQEEEMRDAVHAALDAFERELVKHHEERRHFGKPPGPRCSGTIVRLFTDRGYGFIVTDEGEKVYFHRNALHELDFDSLSLGLPVELDIESGKQGPQASRVFPVGERMAT